MVQESCLSDCRHLPQYALRSEGKGNTQGSHTDSSLNTRTTTSHNCCTNFRSYSLWKSVFATSSAWRIQSRIG